MTNFLKFMFLSLSILSLTSCGSDDDTTETNPLIGTWKAQTYTFDINVNSSILNQETSMSSVGEANNLNYTLEFAATDYSTSGSYDFTVASTIETVGNSFTTEENQTANDVTGNGLYTRSGNTITLDGSFINYTIDGQSVDDFQQEDAILTYEIEGDVLTLTQDQEQVQTNQGITSTAVIKSVSTWTRQ